MASTTITASHLTSEPVGADGRVTWRRGLLTGLVAAAASTAVAAAFWGADQALSVSDADGTAGVIPLLGFAQMVLLGTVIGLVVARRTSRRAFLRFAVVLTVLSCAPSLAWGVAASDKLGLVLTHLVAAAIVIPRLARR